MPIKVKQMLKRDHQPLKYLFFGQIINEGREGKKRLDYQGSKTQEFGKVTKNQIRRYLARRYPDSWVKRIIKGFKFPRCEISFTQFCDFIDAFLSQPLTEQKRLAFELHDWNDDSLICAADLFELT